MASGRQPILSSAPLQVLLYLNSWYFAAFFLAEVLMFIYKGILLPYPSDNLILDVVLLLLYLGLETLRIFYDKVPYCHHVDVKVICTFGCYRFHCDRKTLKSVGRGTCVSAPWPPASRCSSCCPAQRWPSTTCCCRPSSCAWSSSSVPSCSASTAWSFFWALCPYPLSPGRKCTEAEKLLDDFNTKHQEGIPPGVSSNFFCCK